MSVDQSNKETTLLPNSIYANANSTPQNSSSLHISGLPYETTEEDLVLLFKDYRLTSVKVINKNSKTFAQVAFEQASLANKAREDLNGVNFLPRSSQTGIMKPIYISVLESSNLKENFKNDSDRNLLVKNLSRNVSGRDFYLMMREHGEIKLFKLVVDYYGVSKGYGYIYYNEASSAEAAIKHLNEKEVDGKVLSVVNLIHGKTRENFRNNIYVKNFPKEFKEENLTELFSKYGEIKSCFISRDQNGESRGFGFVCFVNPGNANQAFRDLKEQKIVYPGLEPLYLNYAQKKDDRVEMLMKDSVKLEKLTIFARLREDMYLVKTSTDFENEIKNFLKLLLREDYSPRDIKVKMDTKTALITMNSVNDVDLLMSKYVEYSNYYLPRIFLNFFQNKNDRTLTQQYVTQLNSLINPVNMFSNFSNLSIVDPNEKPIITIDPNTYGKGITNQSHNNKKVVKNHRGKYHGNNNYQGNNGGYYNNNYYYNNDYQYKKNRNRNAGYGNQNANNTQTKVNLNKEDSNSVYEEDNVSKLSSATPLHESETKEEVGSTIYEIVERKYPNNAGKITGMIFDLGLREMRNLLEKPEQLNKIIEEANQLLSK